MNKKDKQVKFNRLSALIIAAIIYVYSLGYFFYGLQINEFTKNSKNWPSVQGHITDLEIDSWTSSGKGGHKKYILKGEYSYRVNGREYKNDRISSTNSDDWVSNDGDAVRHRLVKLEQVNPTIQVFYDPDSPSRAALIWEEFSLLKRFFSCVLLIFVGSIIGWAGLAVAKRYELKKGVSAK